MSFIIDLSFIKIDEDNYCGSETFKQAKLLNSKLISIEKNNIMQVEENTDSIFNEFNFVLDNKIKKLIKIDDKPQITAAVEPLLHKQQDKPKIKIETKKKLIKPTKPLIPISKTINIPKKVEEKKNALDILVNNDENEFTIRKLKNTTPTINCTIDRLRFCSMTEKLGALPNHGLAGFYKKSFDETTFPHLCISLKDRRVYLKQFNKKLVNKAYLSSVFKNKITHIKKKETLNNITLFLVTLADDTDINITKNVLLDKIRSQGEVPIGYNSFVN
jgi:hypothetical protein